MFKRLFITLLLTGALFGALFGWQQHLSRQNEAGRGAPPPARVAITEVREEFWQPYLSAVGSLVAVSGIEVANEVAGKVSAIHFKSGQKVRNGQLLIELDSATEQAELKGLRAARRLEQIKFDRLAKLLASKSVSKSDYDQSLALLDEAAAAVEAKQASIEKKQIVAPFSGRLGIKRVDPGQYLPPGSAIVPLQALTPIHADFALPERHLDELHEDQEVGVQVQAYPAQPFRGRITALNPGVDQGTRTVRVRATLDNPQRRLRPGMFAQVRVLLAQDRRVLTLPDTAVTYNPYGDAVFLVESGDAGLQVRSRQIETGEIRAGRVEVRSGLQAGDRVVSAGQIKLRNGMAVVADDKPAPGERGAP